MAFSKPSRLLSEGFPGPPWPDGVTGLPCCSSRALARLARAARVPWQKLGAACRSLAERSSQVPQVYVFVLFQGLSQLEGVVQMGGFISVLL